MEKFSPEESTVLNILAETQPRQYYTPEKKFINAKKKYPESVIVNAFYIKFAYKDWTRGGEPSIAENVLNSIELIHDKVGKTPFTIYYKSQLLWESKIFRDRETAYNDLERVLNKFPSVKKILELFIKFNFQREGKEYQKKVESLYNRYKKFSDLNPEILLISAKALYKINNYELARQICNNIIQITNRSNLLTTSYELLGDMANSLTQKIDKYQQALEYDNENGILWGKLGIARYNKDPEGNLKVARVILNKAIKLNPNQPEAKELLDEIRKKTKIKYLITIILPIVGVVAGGIYILILFERKKQKKEEEMIENEEKKSEPGKQQN